MNKMYVKPGWQNHHPKQFDYTIKSQVFTITHKKSHVFTATPNKESSIHFYSQQRVMYSLLLTTKSQVFTATHNKESCIHYYSQQRVKYSLLLTTKSHAFTATHNK